ncbi:methyltransferase [Novosphingobium piscinae]|uniref:Methyltransferase domain-containing protein n=1 Tax=Novosphingobium piscinae TaxID=1507448 RepID=A0A7X1KPJ0_9SPHN|nr:methyltransferase [Novosphingobium piscinae]MBC2668503.1 methyltransferase domain-containing protein [Novosphingobium piscinae]
MPPRWRVGWTAWRNATIASPRFQTWAARLPLVRGVARRRAAQSFDLLAGFCYSQILAATEASGLLDRLAEGPCNLAAVIATTGLPEPAALRLVRAAAAIDLAESVGPGWWMLGQQGAPLQANPGARAMVRHHALLYADLADPLALLRANRQNPTALSAFWHYSAETEGETAQAYSTLMASSQAMVARETLAAYPFARHRRVVDLGGGHGVFIAALAAACPALGLGVFDLPPVVAGTATRLAGTTLGDRVTLHPGDFFGTPLPAGYDCMTLVRILHDHDDGAVEALLAAAWAALPRGGRLVISEPMADTSGARAMGDGYFGLYLWAMNSGRPRSATEYRTLLQKAGFSTTRHIPTDLPVITSVLVSTK